MTARRKPSAVSLFTGAGGLDYGLEAAGFDTTVAVEMDADACETLRHNRPSWTVLEKSIFEVRDEEILDDVGLKKRSVDLVAGGPPCQPFSKAGNWARLNGRAPGFDDGRATTVTAFMDIVERVLPKVVLLENVEGFAAGGENSALTRVVNAFDSINKRAGTKYKPVSKLLDAADFGVPQSRRRRFIVAARSGREFVFPEARFGEGKLPHMTAWDALGDAPPDEENLELSGKWADLLPTIPEGENYTWHTSRGGGLSLFGWRTRYWTFLLKLAKDRPSWTIQAHPGPSAGPFHWSSRKLSIAELCRLQTFPADVKIQGNRGAAMRQVGNAVPSLLAEVLGREIRRQLLGHHPRYEATLKVQRRPRRPPPESIMPVPHKYMKLMGDHPDHPGPGEGPGAKRRNGEGKASKKAA